MATDMKQGALASTDTLRAVCYARVSTARQAGERHSSLETQQERFFDYCRAHGLSPVDIFTDVASGRKDDRREYRRMLDFVLEGGAQVVVVQYLDRLGRNPREILRRYWQLEEQGIQVIATDEDLSQEIYLLIRAYLAGAESERNSERVRANMAKAIRKGTHVGREPFGFRRVKAIENNRVVTKWEIDLTQARAVRRMYELAVKENLGYKAIADRLTAEGFVAKEGRPFASFTVHTILTNPALKGTLVWGRKARKVSKQAELVEIPQFFPPILSEEEWNELQERLALRREFNRGKTHTSTYLLSGVLRCGHCRGPMVGKACGRYRRYYCSRAMRGRALCSFYNGHSAPKLEKAVLDYLSQFADPKRVEELAKEIIASRLQAKTEHEERLVAIERRIKELDEVLLRDLDRLDRGLLTEEEFRKVSEVRRAEQTKLRAEREEASKALEAAKRLESLVANVPVQVTSFFQDLSAMDLTRRKAGLQQILKAVYVYTDGRIDIEFR